MERGEIKQSDNIGKLKDDNIYILYIMGKNLQETLLKHIMYNGKGMMNIM